MHRWPYNTIQPPYNMLAVATSYSTSLLLRTSPRALIIIFVALDGRCISNSVSTPTGVCSSMSPAPDAVA